MVLGRHPSCEIVLDNAAISRQHAQITNRHGLYFIEDLRSRNRTYLNGAPIDERTALADSDQVKICDIVLQFFSAQQPPEPESAKDDSAADARRRPSSGEDRVRRSGRRRRTTSSAVVDHHDAQREEGRHPAAGREAGSQAPRDPRDQQLPGPHAQTRRRAAGAARRLVQSLSAGRHGLCRLGRSRGRQTAREGVAGARRRRDRLGPHLQHDRQEGDGKRRGDPQRRCARGQPLQRQRQPRRTGDPLDDLRAAAGPGGAGPRA